MCVCICAVGVCFGSGWGEKKSSRLAAGFEKSEKHYHNVTNIIIPMLSSAPVSGKLTVHTGQTESGAGHGTAGAGAGTAPSRGRAGRL